MFVDEKALPEAPVKKLEEWQEYCLKAADYIDHHGWCQRQAKVPDGRVCLLGALASVMCGCALDISANEASFQAVYETLKDRLGEMPHRFNDDPNRTKEEVTGFLRSMAN